MPAVESEAINIASVVVIDMELTNTYTSKSSPSLFESVSDNVAHEMMSDSALNLYVAEQQKQKQAIDHFTAGNVSNQAPAKASVTASKTDKVLHMCTVHDSAEHLFCHMLMVTFPLAKLLKTAEIEFFWGKRSISQPCVGQA